MMLAMTKGHGNIEQVRQALEPRGIADPKIDQPILRYCMLIIRSGFEQESRDHLRRRGIGAYWPNYQKDRMIADNCKGGRIRRTFLAPIVPGIIFSPARFTDAFWNVLDLTPGILNVARKAFGDIVELDETAIVIIHKIEQVLNEPPKAKMAHNFRVGDKVFLTDDVQGSWGKGQITDIARIGRISAEFYGMGRKVTFKDLYPHQIRRP